MVVKLPSISDLVAKEEEQRKEILLGSFGQFLRFSQLAAAGSLPARQLRCGCDRCLRDRLFVVDPICGEAPGEAENKVRYLTASRDDHRRHAAETMRRLLRSQTHQSCRPPVTSIIGGRVAWPRVRTEDGVANYGRVSDYRGRLKSWDPSYGARMTSLESGIPGTSEREGWMTARLPDTHGRWEA